MLLIGEPPFYDGHCDAPRQVSSQELALKWACDSKRKRACVFLGDYDIKKKRVPTPKRPSVLAQDWTMQKILHEPLDVEGACVMTLHLFFLPGNAAPGRPKRICIEGSSLHPRTLMCAAS